MFMQNAKAVMLSVILAAGALLISGCGAAEDAGLPPAAELSEAPETVIQSPALTDTAPPEESGPLRIFTRDELKAELQAAISGLRQPRSMDISAAGLSGTPELDAKNLYYELLSQYPELKYAYDMSATAEGGILSCRFSFMPYKTGDFDESRDYIEVSSLTGLIETAQASIGSEAVSIRITNPALDPDDMNRALQQAGGAYILCALSPDGTEIKYSPAMGMTMEDCLAALREAEALAEGIVSSLITESMGQREKAELLYSYITENVRYDQRYYSAPGSLPYESRTATGALRDKLAICGGYSHALKLLFERAGIPCWSISGSSRGENHMWNIAQLDGQWLWFDATADRGLSPERGLRHFALAELDAQQYEWDEAQLRIIQG